ncbi:four and a half LIM domains protein 2-like [Antennarius striatus]|uniref:four and a half LIM domains protein 2-like n=1 Tax=Antennarius striatus TaxID=241820 RepID=UPI0035B37254
MGEYFNCAECKESLYCKKYILNDAKPHCIQCFESLFCSNCEVCQKLIGCTSKDLSYNDRHWHSECFLCTTCSRSLVDLPFTNKDGNLMCVECYSNKYSSKCYACLKPIRPGCKKMEHKGNSWHEDCFTCNGCLQPIGISHFLIKDGKNYCLPCYKKDFSEQCIQCEKPIMTGGVNYLDQPWHKECFVCCECKQQLASQRFTTRDDSTFCLDCFCSVFFKKCASCDRPVGSLKGSNYISFEQRQWHTDCFKCKKCSESLVGKGFLTCKDDILCSECGRNA